MPDYQHKLARLLASSGCLFFAPNLTLKDGRPSPYFINLGNLRTGKLSWELGQCFAHWLMESQYQHQVDVIVGPSYKGSAIAQATALALYKDHGLDVAFEYDRKEAKTHGEASGGANMFVTGALYNGARVLVVDDVGTSMATKVDILDKLNGEAKRRQITLDIKAIVMAVDREQTQAVYDDKGQVRLGVKGQDAMAQFTAQTGVAVHCLLGVSHMLRLLHESTEKVLINNQWQYLGQQELEQISQYLQIYGR